MVTTFPATSWALASSQPRLFVDFQSEAVAGAMYKISAQAVSRQHLARGGVRPPAVAPAARPHIAACCASRTARYHPRTLWAPARDTPCASGRSSSGASIAPRSRTTNSFFRSRLTVGWAWGKGAASARSDDRFEGTDPPPPSSSCGIRSPRQHRFRSSPAELA